MIITEENKHKYRQVNRIVETYPNGMIKRSEPINKYKENDEPALPAPYIIAPIPKDFVYPAEVESFYLEKLEATDKQVILPDGTPALCLPGGAHLILNTERNLKKLEGFFSSHWLQGDSFGIHIPIIGLAIHAFDIKEAPFQAHATLEAEEMADMPEHLVAATRRTRPLEQFGCVVTSTPTSALGNRLQRQAVPLTEKEASDLFLDSTQQVTIK